jgi:hypothetical protein
MSMPTRLLFDEVTGSRIAIGHRTHAVRHADPSPAVMHAGA